MLPPLPSRPTSDTQAKGRALGKHQAAQRTRSACTGRSAPCACSSTQSSAVKSKQTNGEKPQLRATDAVVQLATPARARPSVADTKPKLQMRQAEPAAAANSFEKESRRMHEPKVVVIELTGGHAVPPAMARMWREGLLTDTTVLVSGESFPAHRVVLACVSGFFSALFCSAPSAELDNIKLPDAPVRAFGALLEFAYYGKCTVAEPLLLPALRLSVMLQVESLREAATAEAMSRLSPLNCAYIFRTAEELSLTELEMESRAHVCRHFGALPLRALAQLTHSQLQSLLNDDELGVSAETEVFEALTRWVHAQKEPPDAAAVGLLLEHVRFERTPLEYVRQSVLPSPLMAPHGMLLSKALAREPRPRRQRVRLSSELLYVLAGRDEDGALAVVEVMNEESGGWVEATRHEWSARLNASGATAGGVIYLFGGYAGGHEGRGSDKAQLVQAGGGLVALASVVAYDPASGEWREAAPMHEARAGSAAAVVGASVTVAGGYNGQRPLSSVELYDPYERRWRYVPSLRTARCDAASVHFDGDVFVLGGHDGADHLRSMERWRVGSPAWEAAAPMTSPRACTAAAVVDGLLWVIGGYDGANALASVEVYDPEADTWHEGPALMHGRYNACVGVWGGRLLVVGGCDGERRLSSVDVFDRNLGVWTQAA
eukprot:3233085-Pleurochrysis_carterae.AAC.2